MYIYIIIIYIYTYNIYILCCWHMLSGIPNSTAQQSTLWKNSPRTVVSFFGGAPGLKFLFVANNNFRCIKTEDQIEFMKFPFVPCSCVFNHLQSNMAGRSPNDCWFSHQNRHSQILFPWKNLHFHRISPVCHGPGRSTWEWCSVQRHRSPSPAEIHSRRSKGLHSRGRIPKMDQNGWFIIWIIRMFFGGSPMT